jgi:hypothetical protein
MEGLLETDPTFADGVLWLDLPNSTFNYGEGCFPVNNYATRLRPDLIFINQRKKLIIIGELTVPSTVWMEKRHEEKVKRYEDLCSDLRVVKHKENEGEAWKILNMPFEISALGGASNLSTLLKAMGLNRTKIKQLTGLMNESAIQASEVIWYNRGNIIWSQGEG